MTAFSPLYSLQIDDVSMEMAIAHQPLLSAAHLQVSSKGKIKIWNALQATSLNATTLEPDTFSNFN